MSDTPEQRRGRAIEIIAHGLFTILFEDQKAAVSARRAKAEAESVNSLTGDLPPRRRRQVRRPPASP